MKLYLLILTVTSISVDVVQGDFSCPKLCPAHCHFLENIEEPTTTEKATTVEATTEIATTAKAENEMPKGTVKITKTTTTIEYPVGFPYFVKPPLSYHSGPAEGDLDCIACKCNASRTDYEVTSHARFMKDRSHQMIGGFNRAETGYGIGFEYPSDKMSSSGENTTITFFNGTDNPEFRITFVHDGDTLKIKLTRKPNADLEDQEDEKTFTYVEKSSEMATDRKSLPMLLIRTKYENGIAYQLIVKDRIYTSPRISGVNSKEVENNHPICEGATSCANLKIKLVIHSLLEGKVPTAAQGVYCKGPCSLNIFGNLGFQCNTNPWQNQDDAYKEWMSFGACSPDKDMHPDADATVPTHSVHGFKCKSGCKKNHISPQYSYCAIDANDNIIRDSLENNPYIEDVKLSNYTLEQLLCNGDCKNAPEYDFCSKPIDSNDAWTNESGPKLKDYYADYDQGFGVPGYE